MAASNAVVKTYYDEDGYVEEGTFTSGGGTATLTITTATQNGTKLQKIRDFFFKSTGGTAIIPVHDATLDEDQIKINFTANDSGTYRLVGSAA